jgi:hypothetical protein
MGAVFKPRPQLAGMLQHAMLDIDLVRLIAGERGIKAVEQPVTAVGGQFVLEQEIAGPSRIAEKQPVAPARAGLLPLLEECPERSDAGARADHDDRTVGCGQAEALARGDVGRYRPARRQTVAEKGRGYTAALAVAQVVPHDAHREMDFARRPFRRSGPALTLPWEGFVDRPLCSRFRTAGVLD